MRLPLRVCLSLLAVLTLTAAAVSTAEAHQAGTTYMSINKSHGGKPRGGSSNLVYHGGPVEAPVAVYIAWWGSEWNTGFGSGSTSSSQAQAYVAGFFANVGGSAWGNTTKQYCGGGACPSNPKNELAGQYVDTTPVPASPTQTDIANAAIRASQHFGFNPNADYMVFTPSGKSQRGFGTHWCAYHSSTGSVAYSYMPYLPDAGQSCGMNFVNANGPLDGFSIVGGHEYAEAITDPQPNSGWVDANNQEIADKCAWIAPGTPGGATDINLGGSQYAVQSLWSNAAGGCATSS